MPGSGVSATTPVMFTTTDSSFSASLAVSVLKSCIGPEALIAISLPTVSAVRSFTSPKATTPAALMMPSSSVAAMR